MPSPEEIEAMQLASAAMVDNPTPWMELTVMQQNIFRALMPQPSFTEAQRDYVRRWWLPVDEETEEDLNGLCPQGMRIEAREDVNGSRWVSCDLLSDALDDGPLSALLPVLETLPLTYLLTDVWLVDVPDIT